MQNQKTHLKIKQELVKNESLQQISHTVYQWRRMIY